MEVEAGGRKGDRGPRQAETQDVATWVGWDGFFLLWVLACVRQE